MKHEYRFLSGRLRQLGLRQSDLGAALGLAEASVSHRMCGRSPWTLDEMYKTLEVCRAQPEELHVYFPPSVEGA